MYTTEQEAREQADMLVKRLSESMGGDWTPRVHENCGRWYAKATLGTASVSINHSCIRPELQDTYTCLLSDGYRFPGGGCMCWDNHTATTPEEAVRLTLESARDYIADTTRCVIEDTMNKMKKPRVQTDQTYNWPEIPGYCEYNGKTYRILNIDMQAGEFILQNTDAEVGDVQVIGPVDIYECAPVLKKTTGVRAAYVPEIKSGSIDAVELEKWPFIFMIVSPSSPTAPS